MEQKYIHKQTFKQNFTFSAQSKRELEILKMDQSEIVRLLLESVQNNPFIDFQFFSSHDVNIIDTLSTTKTLQDDLYFQLHTTPCAYRDDVCSFIIDSLDNHGYLSYSAQEYCEILHVSYSCFQRSLALIQSFEPIGVAAYHPLDAVLLQCKQTGNKKGAYILSHYAKNIINHQYSTIAKGMHISITEVKNCITSLRAYSPYPCAAYEKTKIQFLLPEVDIIIEDQDILIYPIKLGTFSLNEQYSCSMLTDPILKSYFQNANILFETIHKRNVTMMMIVNELVEIQKDYFLYQDELHPCTLKDIAIKLGMSESTVSRALAKKVYRFQGECYPFKYLFVTANIHGDSSDRVRKALIQIINQEDKKNPLSDQQIIIKLSSMNITSSRRTIAKYRKQLGFLSSTKRKRVN